MARERSIVLRLRAEISDYQSKMSQASRSLSDFEREQQKMGGAATTSLGRMVQSAKINEREWAQVGRTMLGVGTAMAGMGVATLKTGIEYNSLRQKATQSLTAVTGSTEKASAQMRRLDEFGKNSWLMRDTLIRAQTQMTGFGIETGKVIPYMDSLADAVAATGGSNQDFEELARLMGQIKSQGKITARELMQFGIRGIDAAQLIGDAMGKTASQIRSEITAGTLDAGAALDALADGMGERFAGASDLVRETFGGAMDNAKAAFRDFAAALATPLVDPEGGGLLVDWVNSVADSLFTLRDIVEDMPGWMRGGILAVGGLTTAATLAGGAFMVALPAYVRFQESLQNLAATHPNLQKTGQAVSKLGGYAAKAAVGVAAANVSLATLSTLLVDAPAGIEEMTVALRDGDLDRGFEHLANGYNSFGEALRTLTDGGLFNRFDRGMQAIIGILPFVTTAVEGSKEQFEVFGSVLSNLATSGDLDSTAEQFNRMAAEAADLGVSAADLLDLMPGFRDTLIGVADAAGLATDDATLLKIATGELKVETDGASGAVDEFGNSVDDAAGSVRQKNEELRAMHEMLREASDQLLDAREAERRWHQALDDATEAVERNGKTLDITTEAGRDNEAQLDNLIRTGRDWVQGMADQGASQSELRGAVQRVRDSFIDQAVQMGLNKRDAERLADQYRLFPDQIDTVIKAHTGDAEENIRRMKARWDGQTITFYQQIGR